MAKTVRPGETLLPIDAHPRTMQTVPGILPTTVSRRTKRAGAVGGLVYALVLLASWYWVHGGLADLVGAAFTLQVGPWLAYAFGGGALVGAVLAVGVVRHRLVAPVVVAAGLYGVAMYRMQQAMQEPSVLLPGTPYDVFLVGWPVVLGLAAAGGVVEWLVGGR